MKQYLKYFVRGFLTMLGAIIAVVIVYVLVQYLLLADKNEVEEVPAATESTATTVNNEVAKPVSGGMYLRELPLTDTQRSMAENFGIDVDTYYISPETISCAEGSLGSERYQAIVDGESPSFVEATKLLNCL